MASNTQVRVGIWILVLGVYGAMVVELGHRLMSVVIAHVIIS